MAKFNIGSTASYSGGGTFLTTGLYRFDQVRFVMFDFNGKIQQAKACLNAILQPLDKDQNELGETKTQYWPLAVNPGTFLGNTEEYIEYQNSVKPMDKGKSLDIPDDATISNKSEFGMFIESLHSHGYPMDNLGDDISVLDGFVAELEVKTLEDKPSKTQGEGDTKKKNFPRQTVVVKSIPKDSVAPAAKPAGKAKTKADPPPADEPGNSPEELLKSYLIDEVLVEKNEAKGVQKMAIRIGIVSYLNKVGLDQNKIRETKALVEDNKVLGAILATAGWALKGAQIVKGE